ncbi:MAG: hypothetical protein KatS3mg030_257 [Saprospiraceae bacterium]|nr:MAG: hypothetical protein KatS3mg030_257 [Saprospiraceae bacterium]
MAMAIPNPKVDRYFEVGCGRCPLGGTPNCKVHKWTEPMRMLRRILLDSELEETVKWRVPMLHLERQKHRRMLAAFKDYCAVSFFKGSLLEDPHKLLHAPGENSQAARLLKFTTAADVQRLEPALRAFIHEAIALEKAGKKVQFKKISEHPVPEEFQKLLEENPALKSAFEALTPGRQRSYLIHFSTAKQPATRIARIQKCIPKILSGKGFLER